MASSYYWVVWSSDNKATVSGPGAKPSAPPGGKVFGPYNTQAEAQQGAALAQQDKGKSGGLSNAISAAGVAISNPLSGVDAIGAFFNKLGEGTTWIRVGEVVLGLILLAVGVARITHAVPAATTVAKTVGAVAI